MLLYLYLMYICTDYIKIKCVTYLYAVGHF